MTESPLVVEQFGRRYRRNRPWAVRDLSMKLPEGSITALVGPNGAGKSTLIRACLGFERPNEGRVLVAGVDPQRERARAVSGIGYVPQAAALYRSMTIGDHLDFAAVARPSFDLAYALARVRSAGLSEERVVGDLSGGEQAQVALALALGTRARLLLLDEPLASLDPLARREFLATLLDDVHTRGATAVLSSHIVTDVEQACDRLVVLVGGRLALDTSVDAAKSEYRTVSTSELNGRAEIGSFAGPAGESLALVHDQTIGKPASLEEIVLGHLAAARSRGPGSRGLMLTSARLTLKLHRFEVGAAALAAVALGVAALVVVYRLNAINVPAGCFDVWLAAGPDGAGACTDPVQAFATINEDEAGKIFAAMAVLPFAVGLLAGVPIVGRELESRTAQTAWSLNGSRLRWLVRQLVPITILVGVTVTFAALAANLLETTREPWYHSGFNDLPLHGPIVVARAFAALGVGLLVGALVGRSLPAFIVGAVVSILLLMGAGMASQSWLEGLPSEIIRNESAAGAEPTFQGLMTAQAWLGPDGTRLTMDEAMAKVPLSASDQATWLEDNGYQLVDLGVSDATLLGWQPYEIVGFTVVGVASLAAGAWVVNRRRPT